MFVGNIFDGATTAIDVGDIGHSLRWRRSASAYIATGKTTSATSTYFACFKQGALDAINPIFDGNIKINANNTITAFGLTTSAVKRDPTSHHWIHVSNNGLVFDGVNLGAVTTSSISSLRIGYDGTNYADMYGSRICCVSGSSVAYTSFVTFNSTINEWVVNSQSVIKALVDAGDASSFMYDFDDGSSTTTLGYDKSSKGNNATLNNFSLTAGTNYDWMLDVPGNSFPVINSLVPVNSTSPTISEANLKWTRASTAPGWTAASMPLPQSGKWYWETDHTSSLNGAPLWTGVVNSTRGAADDNANNIAGVQADTTWNGRLTSGSTVASYLNPGGLNAVIAHAYDGATGKYWCGYVSGGSITWGTNGGVGDPAAGTNALETLTGVVTPAFGQFQTAGATRTITEYFNAGQRPFSASTLPTGFNAVNQANMPEVPTVYLNPRKHADVDIYTGTGSSLSRTAFQFAADFLDIKSRSAATDWALYDSVRGVQKRLESNTTDAEVTSDNGVTSFDSTGFTLGTLAQVNTNTATYAALGIKAGGAGVSNTAGSITSTVSANQDTGFSIVTYTGTGANATVGHGCKVNGVATAPGLVIVFCRSVGTSHTTWHSSFVTASNTDYVYLNDTIAKGGYGAAAFWNNTPPSSTTISIGTDPQTNGSGRTYVAYCFAPGFFSIGSYTGNGSADGPYVHTGHKSRWLMVKNADAAEVWCIWDTARDTYNIVNNELIPNSSGAEFTGSADIDFDAFGFKCRRAGGFFNGSGQKIVYISIPDVFAKYSLAR